MSEHHSGSGHHNEKNVATENGQFVKVFAVSILPDPPCKCRCTIFDNFLRVEDLRHIVPIKDLFLPHWEPDLKIKSTHATVNLVSIVQKDFPTYKIKSKKKDIVEKFVSDILLIKENFNKLKVSSHIENIKFLKDSSYKKGKIVMNNSEIKIMVEDKLYKSIPRHSTFYVFTSDSDRNKVIIQTENGKRFTMKVRQEHARNLINDLSSRPTNEKSRPKITLEIPDVPNIGNKFLDVLNENVELPQEDELEAKPRRSTRKLIKRSSIALFSRASQMMDENDVQFGNIEKKKLSAFDRTSSNPEIAAVGNAAHNARMASLAVKMQARLAEYNRDASEVAMDVITDLNINKDDTEKYPHFNFEDDNSEPMLKLTRDQNTEMFFTDEPLPPPQQPSNLGDVTDPIQILKELNQKPSISALKISIPQKIPPNALLVIYSRIATTPANKRALAATGILLQGRKQTLQRISVMLNNNAMGNPQLKQMMRNANFKSVADVHNFINKLAIESQLVPFIIVLDSMGAAKNNNYFGDAIILAPGFLRQVAGLFENIPPCNEISGFIVDDVVKCYLRVRNAVNLAKIDIPKLLIIENAPQYSALAEIVFTVLKMIEHSFPVDGDKLDKTLKKISNDKIDHFILQKAYGMRGMLARATAMVIFEIFNGDVVRWLLESKKNTKPDELCDAILCASELERLVNSIDLKSWGWPKDLISIIADQVGNLISQTQK